MAFCGEDSLGQIYLASLAKVNAASSEDGRLFLHFADDAGRMGFNNGGAPQVIGSGTDATAMIQPQQVSIDTQGLPYSWQPNLVPATPYDASQPPGPTGLPEHIEINFGVTDPADKWQWTGSTYQGKENPIADPALYEVVYGSDGTLRVKADCNQASGTYTYDGGMVGSVRVTMGPSTLAACGPDSRSDELINSLMAAQDYRVQPGGSELQLNMPAGGPVLSFRAGGAAAK